MPAPRDTSRLSPAEHLEGILAAGSGPDYIVAQEAAGQRELVESSVLPINTFGTDDQFVALGFTFGDHVDGLFRNATLPAGWTRVGTSHDMWSKILDERGVERVGVFYKAAFYDRRAHMSIVRVGQSLGSAFVYDGTEPPWDVLTDKEKADFVAHLTDYVAKAEQYPTIYVDGDRARGRLAEIGGVPG